MASVSQRRFGPCQWSRDPPTDASPGMRSYFLRTPRLGFSTWSADDLPLAVGLWGDPQVTRLIGGPFPRRWIEERLALEIATQSGLGFQYWPLSSSRRAACRVLRARAGPRFQRGPRARLPPPARCLGPGLRERGCASRNRVRVHDDRGDRARRRTPPRQRRLAPRPAATGVPAHAQRVLRSDRTRPSLVRAHGDRVRRRTSGHRFDAPWQVGLDGPSDIRSGIGSSASDSGTNVSDGKARLVMSVDEQWGPGPTRCDRRHLPGRLDPATRSPTRTVPDTTMRRWRPRIRWARPIGEIIKQGVTAEARAELGAPVCGVR